MTKEALFLANYYDLLEKDGTLKKHYNRKKKKIYFQCGSTSLKIDREELKYKETNEEYSDEEELIDPLEDYIHVLRHQMDLDYNLGLLEAIGGSEPFLQEYNEILRMIISKKNILVKNKSKDYERVSNFLSNYAFFNFFETEYDNRYENKILIFKSISNKFEILKDKLDIDLYKGVCFK